MKLISHPIQDLNCLETGIIMKIRIKILGTLALLALGLTGTAIAQVGKPFIHDPSTITECDGKYYTFGTGAGGLISEDGWRWNGGGVRPGGGAAPDVVKIGDRYLIVYGATGGGLGGGHNGRILTMWKLSYTMSEIATEMKLSSPEMAKKYRYRCMNKLMVTLDQHPQLLIALKNV